MFLCRDSQGVPFSQLHYGTIASRGMRQSRIFKIEQCRFKAVDGCPRSDRPLLDCLSFILCSYKIFAQCLQSYLIVAFATNVTIRRNIRHHCGQKPDALSLSGWNQEEVGTTGHGKRETHLCHRLHLELLYSL